MGNLTDCQERELLSELGKLCRVEDETPEKPLPAKLLVLVAQIACIEEARGSMSAQPERAEAVSRDTVVQLRKRG